MAKARRSRGKGDRAKAEKPLGADYDSPWKEALDHYLRACLALFFPRAHAEIDWSRGHEMLDKELQPIVRGAGQGRLYVDKLVKAWLKDGQKKWLLVHVEVQTSREGGFARRMHVYNHRIADRYDREVVSLAMLVDDDPDWRPTRYEYARWGFRSLTEFPVVKLLDHAARYEELEADANPFAVVVRAHLKALETRGSPAERQEWKLRLVKGLYERGMAPEDVRRLFRFIDWVMELPEPQQQHFWDGVEAYQQEKAMPFVSIAGRMTMVKGLLRGIEVALDMKFGADGLELMPELREIRDPQLLDEVLARIKTADSPAALRRAWTRKRRPKATEPE